MTKILWLIFVWLALFLYFVIGITGPKTYYAAYAPNGPGEDEPCHAIDTSKYGNYGKISVAKILENPPGYQNQLLSVKGWLAYYPKHNGFYLRDGLDYLAVDVSSCSKSDIEIMKKRAFPANLHGWLAIKGGEPRIILDDLFVDTPYYIMLMFFSSVGMFVMLVLIGIIKFFQWAIKAGRRSKEKTSAQDPSKH